MRLLLLLLFLVCVLAQTQKPLRTSDEFGLSVLDHHSACFTVCHLSAVQVILLPNISINGVVFVARNCRLPIWAKVVGGCLPVVCKSAPDVSYAVEYAAAWCARSGVDNVTIPMPEWYLQTPGGKYFQNMIQSSATAAAVSFGLMAGALALVSLAPLAFL
ncbi:hypothetical protein CcaverHIS002_0402940 [Cutaneotrichosporon cavernicola]|uniref:Hydrophobin n=1 Tax=Cutaneotrichosporon cavernicola TaxID=279322 RepID=A0AA48QVL7_9TREE|nr:uncharacterized protein CcaverHIS019_0402900 [Cutaneotrichosporon cavernicola]BEI83690.1 hypothetical protein CcaverHIS002_0402940 [Cutaneotrichosporon cavernicola]BEI91470.1 hypothetical protein CcaverHIS019_0402900 [Cutaneotrichosporon cavernicola]